MPPSPAEFAAHSGDRDDIVVLRGATWADYQRLLEIRGESARPRITYLEGLIEIMAPSHEHETDKSVLGRLVEVWLDEHGIDHTPAGSWTIESKESERGAEPDECYMLGSVEAPTRPDIAIEVARRAGAIDKLDVYRKLGVPEVWIWRRSELSVYVLAGEHYGERPRSAALPALDLAELARFVHVRPMSRAKREYRAALRAASAGAGT